MILASERDRVPPYVAARIRRPPPSDCRVLPGSTPVVAFGDPHSARVATLGLNPSRIEFEVKGVELDGQARRFETLRSLGVDSLTDADADVIERVWRRCNGYFHGNPYRWFNRLEEMLHPIGASYYDGSACHLDLTQWATDPTWGKLAPRERERLVADDADFLRQQLRTEPIQLLLLNGRAVIDAFHAVLGGQLKPAGTVADGSVTTRLYTGDLDSIRVIGWSTNLQSSFGVTRTLRTQLAAHLALTCAST